MVEVVPNRVITELRRVSARLSFQRPSLARAFARLVDELALLRELGRVSGPVLCNDWAAIEKMHGLLLTRGLTTPSKRFVRDDGPALALINGGEAGELDADELGRPARTSSPGLARERRRSLIHVGEVALVALAAGRVGQAQRHALGRSRQHIIDPVRHFIGVVLGLVYAASRVNLLADLLGGGLDPKQLALALAQLEGLSQGSLDELGDDALVPCLELLEASLPPRFRLDWSGTSTAPIASIERRAAAGEHWLELALEDWEGDGPIDALFHSPRTYLANLRRHHDSDHWGAVVAGHDHRAISCVTTVVGDGLHVALPQTLRDGWVALASNKTEERARQARTSASEELARLNAADCFAEAPIPLDELCPDDFAVIPTMRDQRFGVAISALELEVQTGPDSWAELEEGERYGPVAVGDPVRVSVEVRAEADERWSMRFTPALEPDPSGEPSRWRIPATQLLSGQQPSFRARAWLDGEQGVFEDERSFTVEVATQRRKLLLLRPGFGAAGERLDDESWEAARWRVFGRTQQAEGEGFEEVEPPSRALLEAAFPEHPRAEADPQLELALARLAALVGRHTGLEDTLVVAVMPGAQPPFWRVEPADGALAVAICTEQELEPCLAVEPSPPRAEAPRLRLVGRITKDGVELELAPRVELRRAGPGARTATPYVVTLRDRQGLELATKRIHSVDSRPVGASFVELLEVWEQVSLVELEYSPQALRVEIPTELGATEPRGRETLRLSLERLGRPQGPRRPLPVVTRGVHDFELLELAREDQRVRWRSRHFSHALPTVELELGGGGPEPGIWLSVAQTSACAAGCFRLDEIAAVQGASGDQVPLRVVVSDGWHSRSARVDGLTTPAEVAGS